MFKWPKASKGGNVAHGQAPDFRDIGDLKGQVAVITGSTSGIGLALARAVAARGGDLVLNGLGDPAEIERTRAALEAGSKGRVRYHPANMMRGEEIADMIAFARHEFGGGRQEGPVELLFLFQAVQELRPLCRFGLIGSREIRQIDHTLSRRDFKAAGAADDGPTCRCAAGQMRACYTGPMATRMIGRAWLAP